MTFASSKLMTVPVSRCRNSSKLLEIFLTIQKVARRAVPKKLRVLIRDRLIRSREFVRKLVMRKITDLTGAHVSKSFQNPIQRLLLVWRKFQRRIGLFAFDPLARLIRFGDNLNHPLGIKIL